MTGLAAVADIPVFSDRVLACLTNPGGDGALSVEDDALVCPRTGERFPFRDGVPALLRDPGVEGRNGSEHGRAVHEENPSPGYEGLEEFGELVSTGLSNPFSRSLLDAIGYNRLILECGCGTGQLSHFLQLNNNHVLGIDMSIPCLRLAMEHRRRNQLVRAAFCQMNIFDLAVRDESFDVVISHGVLHHTPDARRAFAAIVRKAKRGGIVMVGLYNVYARIPTWLYSKAAGLFQLVEQPRNRRESWHSIDEILDWFEENDVEFLNCLPPVLGSSTEQAASLFQPCDPGTPYQRAVTQLSWLATAVRRGGLFDVIGRRAP